jgi:TolB-like protein/DNA-binding winged helix-turn-helix (wHTH) protein/cytochrome c-type biogenesis protein CcmH/NrfG
MKHQEADTSAAAQARFFRIDRYVLDVEAGRLLQDGNEIALRPKTFAVLRQLAENAGRLISKDELFGAVWPDVTVTDDVLVQSIGELRRALGDDGARMVKTVPRRGYRLDADCEVLSSGGALVGATPEAGHTSPASPSSPPPSRTGLREVLARSRAWSLALLALCTAAVAYALYDRAGSQSSNDGPSAGPPRIVLADIAGKPSIAVLPFFDAEGAPAREYLADGLTQDVINALGRFSSLTVMSWNAVQPYKGRPAPPAEIGRGLGVRYHVEGRVQTIDGRVRLSAQLVGADGRVLWSERFDEEQKNVFALQDKLVTRIAGALAIRVTGLEQQHALAKPAASLEAYDSVLRARPALQRPTRAGNAEARALLKRAIELDPGYAAAHTGLAETYYNDVSMGWAQSPAASLNRAKEMADKALNLDGTDVRARVILARMHVFHHRYEQARGELERAIAINPSDAQGIAGRGNIQVWLGQVDAAIEALELAQRIDPDLGAIDSFALSLAYYLKGRYDACIEQALHNLRLAQGAHFSRAVLAAAYAQQNRPDEAVQTARELMSGDPTFDARVFGSKLLVPSDLEHLREGFRKAGL